MKAKVVAPLALVAALLAECEDEGNAGNDNLLTGSLVVVIIIVIVVVAGPTQAWQVVPRA